jgi:peptidyl-dipeptidase Dcp
MIACTRKQTNPFFDKWNNTYEIPPFERITPTHYREAFQKGMEEQMSEIESIVNNEESPSFQNTIVAFDASGQLLENVKNIFFAQVGADATPEILDLENEIAPVLTQHDDEILMNRALFERVKSIVQNTDYSTLSPEDTMLLHKVYLDFLRSGVTLPEAESKKLKEINSRITALETQFSQNLLNETGSYQLIVENEADLNGLSPNLIEAAAIRACETGKPGKWIFGLDNPTVMPFLYYDDNRALRDTLFTAYKNRCNNNNSFDNKEILKNIIQLRREKALLTGYKNYVDYVLEKRMAKNAENIYSLLDQIWIPALNKAKEELSEMQALAGNAFPFIDSDWRYYSEKLKSSKYNLSDEMLRPYFKAENVREGIFLVCNQLYGITFKELYNIPKPHKDAQSFICIDKDGVTELGILYTDLYARPGLKSGGAWCGTYRNACQNEHGQRVKPITYITCNFTPPLKGEPALLTPDEVETFFHETGHAIHNLFKNVKYHITSDVPTDFVELPSQVMEHWAFAPEVLAHYAKHYQTGEIIPQTLIDKMQAASKYGQGFATVEYLAASYLDMDYHTCPSPTSVDVTNFEIKTLSNRGLISQIPPRYRSTYFQHIFAGGYDAGYYSYIWAEVLDCDAYEAFVESGDIFNKEIADRFRKCILECGGIYPAEKMYENFRGKEANINALLKDRGLFGEK